MYSLVLLIVAQPTPETQSSGNQPTQVLARIDTKGNLSITRAMPIGAGCYGSPPPMAPGVPMGKPPVKVKVTTVIVTTAELPAKEVEAFTTDGRTITAEKLAEMLEKERPVLIALDGKKVDPFLLQLYKEGTIVLVPPADTVGPVFGGPGYSGGHPLVEPAPYDRPRVTPVAPPRLPSDRPGENSREEIKRRSP